MSAITGLVELTAVDPDADFVEIVDASVALADRNKKVLSRRFARWELAASWAYASNVTRVDFIGLSAFTELMVMFRGVVCGTSGILGLVVSSNNGSSWKTASGEYSYVSVAGVAGDDVSIFPYGTAATAARSGLCHITGWNLVQPKPVFCARSDFIAWTINDVEACNAISAVPSAGGNITAGNIYIFGR